MDPFSIVGASASLIQLIETVSKAIRYLNDIKNERKERIRVSRELGNLYGILIDLEAKLDDASTNDPYAKGLQSLASRHGPIDQLEDALNTIIKKLESQSGFKKVGRTLIWPFEKKELESIMVRIERQKSTINYALQGDQMHLEKAIKADTQHIPSLADGVQNLQIDIKSMQSRQEGI